MTAGSPHAASARCPCNTHLTLLRRRRQVAFRGEWVHQRRGRLVIASAFCEAISRAWRSLLRGYGPEAMTVTARAHSDPPAHGTRYDCPKHLLDDSSPPENAKKGEGHARTPPPRLPVYLSTRRLRSRQPRIQRIAQPIAQVVERQHHQQSQRRVSRPPIRRKSLARV